MKATKVGWILEDGTHIPTPLTIVLRGGPEKCNGLNVSYIFSGPPPAKG